MEYLPTTSATMEFLPPTSLWGWWHPAPSLWTNCLDEIKNLNEPHRSTPVKALFPAPSQLTVMSRPSMEPPQNFQRRISPDRLEPLAASSPAPSTVSLKSHQSMEPPQNFQRGFSPRIDHYLTTLSPVPSTVSLKSDPSMESPQNLQRRFSPYMDYFQLYPAALSRASSISTFSRKIEQSMGKLKNIKRARTPRMKREAPSPAPSCESVKSQQSMEPPQNFRGSYRPRLKRETPSPAPSALSLKSLTSMEPPQNFQREDSSLSLLTEDHFRCSVCTEVLRDPVSIPCGHSYCRKCITSYWAQPNHAGLYACPQCSQTHSSWPELYTNSALAEVIKKLQKYSPAAPAHSCAGAGDVACDFCTGRKLRAVKSCLTCMASYCEAHVRQHYTVPVLQKHTLVEPEHQDQKLKDVCEIETEDSKQIIQQGKLQLDDMNKRSLKHVSDVQTQTELQQTEETFEGAGMQPQQDDDLQSSQDNDQCYKDMPEKQGEVIQFPKKISTRTRIQPHLRALREKIAALYELQDQQKKKAQEAAEMKKQEYYNRQDVLLKMKDLMMVQKLGEKVPQEHGQRPQALQDALKLLLEMQEELQREQDLQKQEMLEQQVKKEQKVKEETQLE